MQKRLLVVDDDDEIRELLEFDLAHSGYNVETACDGMDGLNKAVTNNYDLVLLDVKQVNPERHKTLTERSNEQTLKTAKWLQDNGKPFWLRYVLVQGYSSFEEDIRALGEHFKGYDMIKRIEVLPYHTLGAHKYEPLGMEYKLKGVKENTPEQLDAAKAVFDEYFDCVFVN